MCLVKNSKDYFFSFFNSRIANPNKAIDPIKETARSHIISFGSKDLKITETPTNK